MPRKRTHGKRRLDAYSGAEAWSGVFRTGFAMFDDFTTETGVALEPRCIDGTDIPTKPLAPPRAAIEEAWLAYGPAFLALYGREDARGRLLWGLQQFGEPTNAR